MADQYDARLSRLLREATTADSVEDARRHLDRFEAEYQRRLMGHVPIYEYEPPPPLNIWRRAASTVRAWWPW